MAKAHKAPMDKYQRKFTVTKHGMERFRDRFGPWLTAAGMLDDQSVGNLLDQLVDDAMEDRKFTVVLDSLANFAPTHLVELDDTARFGVGSTAVVVLRDKHIVTVLTFEMAENNKRNGTYTTPSGSAVPSSGHKPFTALKDMVLMTSPVVREPVVAPVAAPVPAASDIGAAFTAVLKFIKHKAACAFMENHDEDAGTYRTLAQDIEQFTKENL